MKDMVNILITVILLFIIILIGVIVIVDVKEKTEFCQDREGVYIYHDKPVNCTEYKSTNATISRLLANTEG